MGPVRQNQSYQQYDSVAGDEAVLAALRAVNEETALVCWCKPGPCHGDVVQAAATWVRRRAVEQSGG